MKYDGVPKYKGNIERIKHDEIYYKDFNFKVLGEVL
jgi:hypothetical protein